MNRDLSAVARSLDRLAAAHQKGTWDHVTTVAVVLTFLVLIWYTYETYKLRKAAQRQNETAVMPVLAIRVEPPQSYFAASRPDAKPILVLRNEGAGTAFNVEIEPYTAQDRELGFDHGSSVISPGETRELAYDLREGDAVTIGSVSVLYEWINTGRLPDPLYISVECKSVSLTKYRYSFKFTPLSGSLAVLLERMDSPLISIATTQAGKSQPERSQGRAG